MVKKNTLFICSSCEYKSPKWLGKCPDCHSWNSFEQRSESKENVGQVKNRYNMSASRLALISEISEETQERIITGVNEFDRVMGGGVFPGSLTLIGGAPGVGKSTLLTGILGQIITKSNKSILYVSGEESKDQIADRARRLRINSEKFYIYNETNWQNIEKQVIDLRPEVLVIDSIQTMASSDIAAAQGTLSQLREVTCELLNFVKAKNITCFVIGHITKEGSIAGPKVLEHMVDTVIYFEGDQDNQHRILRAMKNRFGSTNEVGLFEMGESGLSEILNPGQYFVESLAEESIGRSVSCMLEGVRPIFIETQALVIENHSSQNIRATQGIDGTRLAMLVAIIEKYLDISMKYNDIYINVVGGSRAKAREIDMSVIASILSSYGKRSLNAKTVFLGEVGLTGEIHPTVNAEIRIKEMEQLQYKCAFLNARQAETLKNKFSIELIGLKKISELLDNIGFC